MIKLGIFWIHQDDIFVLQEASSQVKPIHDVKDIETGHVDYWDTLQRENSQFRYLGYDQVSRGRVLEKKGRILIYSSRDIIQNYKDLIINRFDLVKEEVEFVADEHYEPILDLGYENFDE